MRSSIIVIVVALFHRSWGHGESTSDSVPTVGVLPVVTTFVGDTVGASEGLQMSNTLQTSSAK